MVWNRSDGGTGKKSKCEISYNFATFRWHGPPTSSGYIIYLTKNKNFTNMFKLSLALQTGETINTLSNKFHTVHIASK